MSLSVTMKYLMSRLFAGERCSQIDNITESFLASGLMGDRDVETQCLGGLSKEEKLFFICVVVLNK